MDNNLSKKEISKYSRQLLLPEISIEGQLLLRNAKVLIVGAGGLGSPAALYLAGAGVGTIGIIDGDVVEESNLHRQIIHNTTKLGVNKANSAKQMINLFNELVDVKTYEEYFNPDNAYDIVKDYDIVMDASDNVNTRYLKVLVSGCALRWDGQITLYGYKDGPCYRCLFPKPPPPSCSQNCSEGGVLGVIPGIIGQIQALEIIKLILKLEGVLYKKLLIFNGLKTSFKTVTIRGKNKECEVCGENPTISDTRLYDYENFCQTGCNIYSAIKLDENNNISIDEFANTFKNNANDIVLLDIRPEEQYKIVSLKNSINIPYDNLENNYEHLKILIFVMCRVGNKSRGATEDLLKNGFINVKNVEEGIFGYINKHDASLPKY